MQSILGLWLLPLLAGAALVIATTRGALNPVLSFSNAKTIPHSYIIFFKEQLSHGAANAHYSWVQDIHAASQGDKEYSKKRVQDPFHEDVGFGGLKHIYNFTSGLLGYSGHFDDEMIQQIQMHPDVGYVERDSEVHTRDEPISQDDALWGLSRISHRSSLNLSNCSEYLYARSGGEGVDVYVVDTGVNINHTNFQGRAHWSRTVPDDQDTDGNGHGTHCAGTIAGKTYGVAKQANIYAVKVLDSYGGGTTSDVIKGVEWVAAKHTEKVNAIAMSKSKRFKGSVMNMSLGGGKSVAFDLAVTAAVDAGVHTAIAAGNENDESCNYSPVTPNGITVGASTVADTRANFSNFGECNDVFAPGLDILSTWIGSDDAVKNMSGTSMAAPHISGLLAYLLSLQPSKHSAYAVVDITPSRLKRDLLSIATKGALSDVPSNTYNFLAWNGGGEANYTKILEAGEQCGQGITHSRIQRTNKYSTRISA